MASIEILLKEAIRLELLVGELYLLFHRQYPEDERFWWKLAMEEENHAALLKTAMQMSNVRVAVPEEMLPESLQVLKDTSEKVIEYINSFEQSPDRTKAFHTAYFIENSAGELHYNQFMNDAPESEVRKVFKKLNGSDLDHADRIIEYMKKQGITPKS